MKLFEYYEVPTYWLTASILRTWACAIENVRDDYVLRTEEMRKAEINALEAWGENGRIAMRLYNRMVSDRCDAFDARLNEFFLPDDY